MSGPLQYALRDAHVERRSTWHHEALTAVRLREHLGASAPARTIQITLFIPGADRDGRPIDQERRLDEALRVFGELFRGATAVSLGRSVVRDEARAGALVFDDTMLVTSYVAPDALDAPTLRDLRRFLHRLGREGRQGEVGIVIDGSYFGITEFDAADG